MWPTCWKPFVQSPDFALLAHAWYKFGVNPCDELGIVHSVDRTAFLLACARAVQEEEERMALQMVKLQVEKTARRIYDYIAFYWSGQDVPPIESLFSVESAPTVTRENGDTVMIDGEEFTVLR